MFCARPIHEIWMHSEQLMHLMKDGQAEGTDTGYRTYHCQLIRVTDYLPRQGMFPPTSTLVKAAQAKEAGNERRRAAHREYLRFQASAS